MSISRRGFFGLLAAGVAVTPQLAELLVPKRTIFLPPKGGWVTSNAVHWRMHNHELWVFSKDKTELFTVSGTGDFEFVGFQYGADQWSAEEIARAKSMLVSPKPLEFNRI